MKLKFRKNKHRKPQKCQYCYLWKNWYAQKDVLTPICFEVPPPLRNAREHHKSHEFPQIVFIHFFPGTHLWPARWRRWLSSEALGSVAVGLQHQLSKNLAIENQEKIMKGTLNVRRTASSRRSLPTKERVRCWLPSSRSPYSLKPDRRIIVGVRIITTEPIVTELKIAQIGILVHNKKCCIRSIHRFIDNTNFFHKA